MIITSVEIIPVRLPLREPFVVAYASYPDTLSILVRVCSQNGAEGWGEATPDPNVTGETWAGTAETLRHDLAPALIGRDARDRERVLRALDARIEGAPSAKAALDIALHDLVARSIGIPLWQLLGGRARDALQISRVISMGEPAAMAAAAIRHVEDGFRTVKAKVGDVTDPRLDVHRVAAVRDAVGPDIAIKVDVNQGWRSPGTAIQMIRAIQPSQPAYIEQPVLWWDMEGLAEVRRQTGAIIMIDEGCHGPRDMLRAVNLRAADLVNIKLMKTGGILNALRLNAIAEAAGISAQVGTMVESSIASAAGLHTAIAMANVKTVEMGGPLMLAEDIGDARAWYQHDLVSVPDAPGLGIDVDVDRVRRFSDTWWMVDA
ncbi:MAG TPA: dipeptide epimerase [Thermomicrobiales bacterium]|nr:dipeptide epimerase [Thermomicrobiales bacterium]